MSFSFKGDPWPDKIDGLIRLFIYILAFWLPYSQAVIESCVISAVLLWIMKRLLLHAGSKEKRNFLRSFYPPASLLERPIYCFLFVCFLSVLSSVLWMRALEDFITKFMEWFAVFWLIQESFRQRKQIFLLLGIFIFSAGAVAIDGIVQYYFLGRDLFNGEPVTPDGRVTASFNAPGSLGGYIISVIPTFLSLFFISTKRSLKLLSLMFIGLLLWTLMLTFTRGAWAGGVAGIIVYFLAYFSIKGNVQYIKTFVVGSLFILLTILFPLVLNMDTTLKLLKRSNTVSWRINVWKDSWGMIKDRPLFGHGINTYMPIFQSYRRDPLNHPTYAHNCYVQLAAEVGLLGLAGFGWILITLFRQGAHSLRRTADRSGAMISIGLLAGIAAFLVHSCFDTNFYSLQLGVLLWLMIGVQTKLNHLI